MALLRRVTPKTGHNCKCPQAKNSHETTEFDNQECCSKLFIKGRLSVGRLFARLLSNQNWSPISCDRCWKQCQWLLTIILDTRTSPTYEMFDDTRDTVDQWLCVIGLTFFHILRFVLSPHTCHSILDFVRIVSCAELQGISWKSPPPLPFPYRIGVVRWAVLKPEQVLLNSRQVIILVNRKDDEKLKNM